MLALCLALAFQAPTVHLTVHPDRVVARFDPQTAIGGAIDGHEQGENAFIFSRPSQDAMLAAGLGPLTYRLRTELAGEAWHWNPKGRWSDPKRHEGYWTSDAKPSGPILKSYGYRLPRRGNTVDQANNDGYSRIVDGSRSTFWKSNPYADPVYGGESYEVRPQWIAIEFNAHLKFDTLKIDWGKPYAKRFRVEVWKGDDYPEAKDGTWVPFPCGELHGHGGDETYRLGEGVGRFVRILLLESSGVGGGRDRRDNLGFAVREIEMGSTAPDGEFTDEIDHAPNRESQSLITVSSTDPWHRAKDLDPTVEQPGFDLIFRSRLSRGLPVLMPTPALYDTPENVEAEARWLRARGYPIRGFEIGEEPDGQSVDAEIYAALYLQMAGRIRRSFPKAAIGGPSFQSTQLDFTLSPRPGVPWLTRFRTMLHERGRDGDFNFCTFEWYPFDDVTGDPGVQLIRAPGKFAESVGRLNREGMADVPWMVTEYGISAFGGPSEVELPGAIFNLDCVLTCLRLGGRAAFLYGYEPNDLLEEVKGHWGNNMLFQKGSMAKMPTFYGAQLLTTRLCRPSGVHRLLAVDGETDEVGCYPVLRPDGRLSIALLNRSPTPVSADFGLPGTWEQWQYSPTQYQWHADAADGRPSRDLPPEHQRFTGEGLRLPGFSITVLVEASK